MSKKKQQKQTPSYEERLGWLTDRERETLEQLGRGLPNDRIAEAMDIEPDTVRRHLVAVFRKLEVENRVQAALFAVRSGLTPLHPEG